MPVIPALPWAGKHAGGFCLSRSFLALGGSREPWAFLCWPVNITSVPPCRLSGCWVLRSRALLAGDGQTSSWKHFLWTSLSRTQTRVSLAGPRPPRWQQHWPLGGLGQSLTLSSKTLSFPNTRAWSSCPTCTCGSFSGLSLSSYLLFLPEVQNGSLAASRTGQRILFGPHRAFCL